MEGLSSTLQFLSLLYDNECDAALLVTTTIVCLGHPDGHVLWMILFHLLLSFYQCAEKVC